jgi:hypothetical protein
MGREQGEHDLLADTTTREVTAMLRATGSTDPDVLFAAKTEFARPYAREKACGLLSVALGLAVLATIALANVALPFALVSAPLLILGHRCRQKGVRNLTTIEVAYRLYSPPRRHDE